jgi:hypothetical protein
VEKEAVKEAVKNNTLWRDYFYSIRTYCPWSYKAWKQDKIEVVLWKGEVKDLNGLEARVYCLDRKPRLLKKIEQRLNSEREFEEWLHSHPSFGINSTPVPVLIQQDRLGLQTARNTSFSNGI